MAVVSLALVLCWYLVLKLITSITASIVAAVFNADNKLNYIFQLISYCFSVSLLLVIISYFSVTLTINWNNTSCVMIGCYTGPRFGWIYYI